MQNKTAGPSSTLNLESLRVTVPEIWPGQDRGGKKRKKKKKEKRRKKNELAESHKAFPTGIANEEINEANSQDKIVAEKKKKSAKKKFKKK